MRNGYDGHGGNGNGNGHYPLIGMCPRCKHIKQLTKHHILPKRFFKEDPRSPILFICRDCHDLIERIIPQTTQLPVMTYYDIAKNFLEGVFEFLDDYKSRRK